METSFKRGNQRCGFYDANLPHGGLSPDQRETDDLFRFNRDDPKIGTQQITTGFRKWAERYISQCSGQRNNNYQDMKLKITTNIFEQEH